MFFVNTDSWGQEKWLLIFRRMWCIFHTSIFFIIFISQTACVSSIKICITQELPKNEVFTDPNCYYVEI